MKIDWAEKLWTHTEEAARILEKVMDPELKPDRYSVGIYDRAGLYDEKICTCWIEARIRYWNAKEQYPGKEVRVMNLDRCDVGMNGGFYNGLTEEQEEQLDDNDLDHRLDRAQHDREAGREEVGDGDE